MDLQNDGSLMKHEWEKKIKKGQGFQTLRYISANDVKAVKIRPCSE